MRKPRLLSFLRNTSFLLSILCAILSVIVVCMLWISKPITTRDVYQHIGVSFGEFTLTAMPPLVGVEYQGKRNDSIFFSGGLGHIQIGQEGTPKSLINLSNWRSVVSGVLYLFISITLYLLGREFGAIREGQSFTIKSVRRVRMMGWCFITHFGLNLITLRVIYYLTQRDFRFQQLRIADNLSSKSEIVGLFINPHNPGYDTSTLFLGLFAFAMAELIHQGLLIKQENDLTV